MPDSPSTPDVLVVGAGPTGLTMACELARHGVSLRIIDQADAPSDQSRAPAVHSRTLEALETMGIADELVAKGVQVHGVNIYANRQRIVHLSMDELDTRYPYVLSVPQSETERTLGRLLSRLGGKVERPLQLTGFTQEEDGVTATLRHPDARQEEVRARWLVGCDGAHSMVRKGLGLPFEGSRYDEAFMLADVRLEWGLPDDEAHAFLTPDGVVAAIPLPGGRHRLILDVPGEGAEEDQAGVSLEQFRAVLDSRGLAAVRVSDPTWIATFRIHRRLVLSFRVGRVFLAGDAAHIHSPVGGQGMNLGIQDAVNLAWKLALVTRGAGRPVLLDSYQAERHPIAAATVSGTDLATRVVTLRNPIAQALRNQLAGFLSSLEVVQHRLTRAVSGLVLNYRRSPIVAEYRAGLLSILTMDAASAETPRLSDWRDFGAAPSAGDHAPDGRVSLRGSDARVRLFELLRTPRHTLVLFDGRAATTAGYRNLAEIGQRVRNRYGSLIAVHILLPSAARPEALHWDGSTLLDPEGDLHHRYGAASESLYLIRPDGYVAYRSQPADADRLFAYLTSIFL